MASSRRTFPKTLVTAPSDDAVEGAAEAVFTSAKDAGLKAGEMMGASFDRAPSQTHAIFEKAKVEAEHNASAFAASFEILKTSYAALNEKSLDAFKSFVEAQVAFAKSALGAKTMADVATLQSDFAKTQVELFAASSKELGAHAQKVATDVLGPIRARMESAFHFAA